MNDSRANKGFRYYLPFSVDTESTAEENGEVTYTTDTNSVIIIGANGSGKSRLGAWMEARHPQEIQRISALRNLSLPLSMKHSSFQEDQNNMMYGRPTPAANHDSLYPYSYDTNSHRNVTAPVNNFEASVGALVAKENNVNLESNRLMEQGKEEEANNLRNQRPEKALQRIFTSIFPTKFLKFKDESIAVVNLQQDGDFYNMSELSDGERAALYMIAQIICLPENLIIVIDEPEIHFHPGIINTFWNTMESERPDCLFIYMTHNLDFAEEHENSDKIWLKSYINDRWEYEKLQEACPTQLELEVLGSSRPLLLVEGNEDSYDYQLYSLLFPEYRVISQSGCNHVFETTRLLNKTRMTHHKVVYGIVDRDQRSNKEIEELKLDKVYVLKVSEVENLFLTEEVIRIFLGSLNRPNEVIESNISNLRKEVYKRLMEQKDRIASAYAISEANYAIHIEKSGNQIETYKAELAKLPNKIDVAYAQKQTEIDNMIDEEDYTLALQVLNDKGLLNWFGKKIGYASAKHYVSDILNLIKKNNEESDAMKNALRQYISIPEPIK